MANNQSKVERSLQTGRNLSPRKVAGGLKLGGKTPGPGSNPDLAVASASAGAETLVLSG